MADGACRLRTSGRPQLPTPALAIHINRSVLQDSIPFHPILINNDSILELVSLIRSIPPSHGFDFNLELSGYGGGWEGREFVSVTYEKYDIYQFEKFLLELPGILPIIYFPPDK